MTNLALTVLFLLAVALYAARPNDEPDTDDSLQRLLERRRCEERQASMSLYPHRDRRVVGVQQEAAASLGTSRRQTHRGEVSNEYSSEV